MSTQKGNPYAESAHIAAALDYLERATQAMNGAIGALTAEIRLTATFHSTALSIGMAIDELVEHIHERVDGE